MRLALWQGTSPAADIDTACAEAEAALTAASALGAAALVLPEIWLPGYNQPISAENALPQDAPEFDRLSRAAAAARCA